MRALWAVLLLALTALTAHAEVPLDGSFVAGKNCPAVQSIAKQTNPGGITVTPGKTYQVIATNKAEPTHYWIVVPGAQPDRRWVAVECGNLKSVQVELPFPSPSAPVRTQAALHDGG